MKEVNEKYGVYENCQNYWLGIFNVVFVWDVGERGVEYCSLGHRSQFSSQLNPSPTENHYILTNRSHTLDLPLATNTKSGNDITYMSFYFLIVFSCFCIHYTEHIRGYLFRPKYFLLFLWTDLTYLWCHTVIYIKWMFKHYSSYIHSLIEDESYAQFLVLNLKKN